jgi:hypothetical protein
MQLLRQRRADTYQTAPIRILEADAVRMQKQTLHAKAPHLLVEFTVAVFVIACNRVPGIRGMHTDLMRTPGKQAHFQQRRQIAEELHHAKLAGCLLATGVHHYRTFAADTGVRAQRRFNALSSKLPLAAHQHQITLVKTRGVAGRILAQQGMQTAQS